MTTVRRASPGRRPSMADVGRVAEVSAQTVSRYYTGGYVSTQSRARIEAAVRELGYTHSRLPQMLRAQRSRTLGFLAMGPINYGNAGILTGIGHAARAARQDVLTTQLTLDPAGPDFLDDARHALDGLISAHVDGVLVATPYLGMEDLLAEVAGSIPLVVLAESTAGTLDSVHTDSYGAARLAVEHLLALGHTRVLHLAGPADRIEAHQRARAYSDAMSAAGCAPLPLLRCAEWDAASGARAAEAADPAQFTAVAAANDEIALGFMSALRERGYSAPGDYSITGVDDMPETRFFAPPLTSAGLDFEQLGERAVGRLLDAIDGVEPTGSNMIPAWLAVRESTRAIVAE